MTISDFLLFYGDYIVLGIGGFFILIRAIILKLKNKDYDLAADKLTQKYFAKMQKLESKKNKKGNILNGTKGN